MTAHGSRVATSAAVCRRTRIQSIQDEMQPQISSANPQRMRKRTDQPSQSSLMPMSARALEAISAFVQVFWTSAITRVEARSAERRPESAKARSRGRLGPGWAASAMGI